MEMIKKLIKSPQIFFPFVLIVIIIYMIFFSGSTDHPISTNTKFNELINKNIQVNIDTYDTSPEKKFLLLNKILQPLERNSNVFYSVWPRFFDFSQDFIKLTDSVDDESTKSFIHSDCGIDLTIENFKNAFNKWSNAAKDTCQSYFRKFIQMYDVKFKENNLSMNENLKVRVKEWLGNNEELLEKSYNQVT